MLAIDAVNIHDSPRIATTTGLNVDALTLHAGSYESGTLDAVGVVNVSLTFFRSNGDHHAGVPDPTTRPCATIAIKRVY